MGLSRDPTGLHGPWHILLTTDLDPSSESSLSGLDRFLRESVVLFVVVLPLAIAYAYRSGREICCCSIIGDCLCLPGR